MLRYLARLLAITTLVAAPLIAQTTDPATHRAGFFRSSGARLHYLEWPGPGPTVVLLPGYSLTAHAFDDIAPRLAKTHRVIALTPRGFGESDAPDAGPYTIDALVGDLRALYDSLHITQATLVAHSLSGTVAAVFALGEPARVTRLVLLDAFPYFKEERGDSIETLDPISVPEFTGDTTYEAAARYLARYRFVPWQPALLADLRAKPLEPEASRRRRLTAAYIDDQWRAAPALPQLRVPAVELCAIPTVRSEYPWLRAGTDEYRQADRHVRQALVPFARRLCARFARTVPHGDTVTVSGSHYVFFTQPARTAALLLRVMR
jgi:pimeloyl-ACP methyl ester carboxylesterase